MAKTVRVHDDTHRALKRLKSKKRARSIDEVIREIVKISTGLSVGEREAREESELLSYVEN